MKSQKNKNTEADKHYLTGEFMRIEDLLYAPLQALSISNQNLRRQVIDEIKSMSEEKGTDEHPVYLLDNLNDVETLSLELTRKKQEYNDIMSGVSTGNTKDTKVNMPLPARKADADEQ